MPSIDRLGRIVIPATIRQQAGLVPGALVDVEVAGRTVVLRPAGSACIFCGGPDVADTHMDKGVCARCLRALRSKRGGTA
jgi:AbrB family looped-hinge helix DNA binding protein